VLSDGHGQPPAARRSAPGTPLATTGDEGAAELVRGSCVAIDGAGVLLQGPSGAGKSDLALRLIDGGALLVADDYTLVRRDGERILAAPPPAIAGLLEVRGVGIVRLPVYPAATPIALVVALTDRRDVPRLPADETTPLLGAALPLIHIAPFDTSATIKVRLAVRLATRGIMAIE
jgi:HPr kinase/phosphorylase